MPAFAFATLDFQNRILHSSATRYFLDAQFVTLEELNQQVVSLVHDLRIHKFCADRLNQIAKGAASQTRDLDRRLAAIENRRWYTQTTNITALLAFLLSLTTAALSAIRTHNSDISQAQQLIAQHVHTALELTRSIQREPQATVQAAMQLEAVLVAQQAAGIAKEYKEHLPVPALVGVSDALIKIEMTSEARLLAEEARKKAESRADILATERLLGSVYLKSGSDTEAAKHFSIALGIFKSGTKVDGDYESSTHFATEMTWASMLASEGRRDEACDHFANALNHARRATDSELQTRLISAARDALDHCRNRSPETESSYAAGTAIRTTGDPLDP